MVEQRSPKPRAEGSSPSAPAKKKAPRNQCFFFLVGAEKGLKLRHDACRGEEPTAPGGRGREASEGKKQGELRSAPSEQGDYVSDGQLQIVLLPLPKEEHRKSGVLLLVRGRRNLIPRHEACRASSPTRYRWQMKRGENGAAVKICRRSKPKQILGTARGRLCCPSAQLPALYIKAEASLTENASAFSLL